MLTMVWAMLACSEEKPATNECASRIDCADGKQCFGARGATKGQCAPCAAAEIPYDGDDNDCDTKTRDRDLDEDGDNWRDAPLTPGGDCDDNDAEVSSTQYEVCGDAKDNDCDGTPDEADCADRNPPTVTFVSPPPVGELTDLITVEVSVVEDAPLSLVELFLDDVRLATFNAPPYTIGVDTRYFADGVHKLRARALNIHQQEGTAETTRGFANYRVTATHETCASAKTVDFSVLNPVTLRIDTNGAASNHSPQCCGGFVDVAIEVTNLPASDLQVTCSTSELPTAAIRANGACVLQDPNATAVACSALDVSDQYQSGDFVVVLRETSAGPFLLTLTAASPTAAVPSFATQIHPLLFEAPLNGGAGCRECHTDNVTDSNAPGSFFISSTPSQVHTELTAEAPEDDGGTGAAARVNTQQPDQSLVLINPLFGHAEPHPRKLFFGVSDPKYKLIRSWIEAGAPNN